MGWKNLTRCFWRWKNTNALRWKLFGGIWWVCSHLFFCKVEFLVVHREGVCAHPSPASCSLGWGGQLGCERHSLWSWEWSLESWQPEHFPHQGTVRYLFSSFLSPTHSFRMRPIGSQWDGEGRTALQSQSVIVRCKNWASPSSDPKKWREEVRVAAWSLPTGQEGLVEHAWDSSSNAKGPRRSQPAGSC